ncbi:MAG: hypothetical protein Q8P73_05125 [bacterium]|nr:hypothetical protein [bacterium]
MKQNIGGDGWTSADSARRWGGRYVSPEVKGVIGTYIMKKYLGFFPKACRSERGRG